MRIRLLSAVFVAFISSTLAFSQGRILPILESTPDVRSTALGGAMLGDTKQMHIYSNPAAAVLSDERMSIDLSSQIFPAVEVGRIMQFNLGTNIELDPNRVLLFGSRWRGGQTIPITATTGDAGVVRPFEWTLDLGYAFKVIPSVVAYATTTYFKSDMGRSTSGIGFSVGAGYQKLFKINQTSTLLTLGLRLQDVGKPIKYGDTGIPYSLPTSIQFGGDWQLALSPKHQVAWALSARYFTPKNAQLLLVSSGIEYSFNNLISARIGYRYGQKDLNQLSCGIGGFYKGIRADISYQYGLSKLAGVDALTVGVGYSF